MKIDDIGEYFRNYEDMQIYKCVAYISKPSFVFKDIKTGQVKVVVPDSIRAEEFIKLDKIPDWCEKYIEKMKREGDTYGI